jgi:hypothetical protein
VVQRDRELHHAQSGADVPTGARAHVHHARAQVVGERAELVAGKRAKVSRRFDTVEKRHERR